MDHQDVNHQSNRRNFLKQAALGGGALAGLPSLDVPLLAADSGSRIKALELLVLKQNREQRRVLKVISSTGAAGYADFPDLDYAPALGGVAKKHLIGANPFAVEAIWSQMRRAGVLCSHRTALDYALWDLLGKETGRPVYELLGGPVRDRIRIYYYGKPPKQQLENEDAWRALGRELAKQPGAVVKVDPWLVFERFGDRKVWEDTVYEAGGRMPTEENIAYNEMVFRCLREGAGDKVDLIHGGHGQCSAEGAIATCKPLEPYDLFWIEEPTAPTSSMDEMAIVAAGHHRPHCDRRKPSRPRRFHPPHRQASRVDSQSVSTQCGRPHRSSQDCHPGRTTRRSDRAAFLLLWPIKLDRHGQLLHGHSQRLDPGSEHAARKSDRSQGTQQASVLQRTH